MKEKYVKPEVELIEFTLTEAIASCAAQIANYGDLNTCKLNEPFNSIGVNFGATEGCTVPVDDYCYFTSTSMIFSS